MDAEQEITVSLLNEICTKLVLREEIPMRLIYRAIAWSAGRIACLESSVEAALNALQPVPPQK